MTNEINVSTKWLGRDLTIKTGKLAKQADACVTVQYGDTVVMATVVQSDSEREGVNFFPLMVDFEEKLYAAGIIKGSRWVKREGRPSDDAVLNGRMVDRAVRPLFDDSSRKDIQVIVTILSVDQVNDHDIVSLIAASAALSISGVNWRGPIGGVRAARVDGKYVFNPTYEDQDVSDMNIIVAGTEDRMIMLEAGMNDVEDDIVRDAIIQGQKEMQPAIKLINDLKSKVEPKEKKEEEAIKDESEIENDKKKQVAIKLADEWLDKNVKNILFDKQYYTTKSERKGAVKAIKNNLNKYLFEEGYEKALRSFAIEKTVGTHVDTEVTKAILEEDKRVDGRKMDEIRELTAEVGVLPRNHGAGLFSRGETQIMSIATLGAPGLEQLIETMKGESKKRYMHHYNFPPYSVGEAKPLRGAGRREIGHGALAEKALEPVMPPKDDFAYTIRVVSETLGSNGSSSMGSTCASTLALMDAGVPITKHVGGIAMGLASNDDMSKWKVITDIQDLEDGKGGMDFKITGTYEGLTAIQLDTKTEGLTEEIIKETFAKGRVALNQVIDTLKEAIPGPREDLSPYAPRLESFYINPLKIRDVIGSGGKIINEIIDACEVSIDIEDDGLVMICGTNAENTAKAVKWVKDLTRELEVGEVFKGKVVRMMDFGAFIEVLPGRDGMVHVSEMAPYRVSGPDKFLSVGDEVTVRVHEIDDQGRVNLTMKNIKENEPLWKDKKGMEDPNSRPPMRGGNRPGQRPNRNGGPGGQRRNNGPRR